MALNLRSATDCLLRSLFLDRWVAVVAISLYNYIDKLAKLYILDNNSEIYH